MKEFIRNLFVFAAIFTVSAFAVDKVYMPPVGTTNIHSAEAGKNLHRR